MTQQGAIVLHAYDARNRGDGLLVAETVGLLRRAGVPEAEIHVVALVAASFPPELRTVQYPGVGRRGLDRIPAVVRELQLAVGGLTTAGMLRRTDIGRLIGQARMLVAVGGGYLRSPGGTQSVLTAISHLPQLALAAAFDGPTVYLPQSIGPFEGPVGAAVKRHLRDIDWVGVRDDTSAADLDGIPSVHRSSDLAVLALARVAGLGENATQATEVLGIGRALDGAPDYDRSLMTLSADLGMTWAVHSEAIGQDDGAFYRRLGLPVGGSSQALLASERFGVVISTRLHGAIQSVIAGVPAIHLSYERKGWGAYGDLGLTEWVHDARDLSVDTVLAQAQDLLRDPAPYWAAVRANADRLRTVQDELVDRLRSAWERTTDRVPAGKGV